MKITVGKNAYGKNAVNISKITRHNDHHEFRHATVNISLQGEFDTAHTIGDNTAILPTDTQKNTIYILAREFYTGPIEAFALHLANHFISNNAQVSQVTIDITEHAYRRMMVNGEPHPHAFQGSGPEKHITTVINNRDYVVVRSGIKDMLILKTADSGFENYLRDKYTSLKETSDRILATQCEIEWTYQSSDVDFEKRFNDIRSSLLGTFANHKSLSLQHTMYAMGEHVLKEFEEVKEISFQMPNKHHILFNLEQFDLENNNDIFIATDEPYGMIVGTVVRNDEL